MSVRACVTLLAISVAALFGPATLNVGSAGQEAAGDPLEPLRFMIGTWEGAQEGQPGTGKVEREYTGILSSRFVRGQNRSIYPAQAKNPKGEVHEHLDIFSFDKTRGRLVLRQFHVEGFVNQYVADPVSSSGLLVFTSEAIENIPAGWRARETYTVIGPNEFEEVFELAGPGKPFEVYSRARLKRAQ